ncbi:hypothetical protein EWB00_010869 [Schistosoma japonicum]|uniref:Uncharacterized protein n=1 Tax=Schistosoma japonicum TaxID=6182 RepID=A0A4Z2CKR2_SCHJA|nr:hypothetical protein EWB00_010869 [Schistosoma japonicum]
MDMPTREEEETEYSALHRTIFPHPRLKKYGREDRKRIFIYVCKEYDCILPPFSSSNFSSAPPLCPVLNLYLLSFDNPPNQTNVVHMCMGIIRPSLEHGNHTNDRIPPKE